MRKLLLLAAFALFCWNGTAQAAPAERIVSLAPSITEALDAIGLMGSVVAVSEHDDFPPVVRKLPKVGGYATPSIERILSFRPTLVVGESTFHGQTLARLSGMGVRTLSLDLHRSLDQVDTALKTLGRELGRKDEADRAVKKIRSGLESTRRQIRSAHPGGVPSVLVVVWHDPLTVAGRTNYIQDILTRLAIPNAAHRIVFSFPQVDRETVLSLDPDIVVLAQAEKGMATTRETFDTLFRGLPLRAARSGRVVTVRSDSLFHPGPRVLEAARLLARALDRGREGEVIVP
ncbi:MAG: ABC transporter substrate-binding protein [Synergistales bacterium]